MTKRNLGVIVCANYVSFVMMVTLGRIFSRDSKLDCQTGEVLPEHHTTVKREFYKKPMRPTMLMPQNVGELTLMSGK